MQRIFLVLMLVFAVSFAEEANESEICQPVPLTRIFDGILINSGKSLIFNYGIQLAVMSAGTYAMVETGLDWEWREFAYRHKPVRDAGTPAVTAGGLFPILVPVSLYSIGRFNENSKLQLAGIAVAQASILTTALTTGIKAFTSRQEPHLFGSDRREAHEDFSDDFQFGFLRRVPFDGWPSGHTSAAWAMAAVLTEFYPDNILLAAGLYTYAAYIGLGVSTTIHWLSDGFAGALFGYAVGKTVARHFLNQNSRVSIVALPNQVSVIWKI
ncbi:MAG: phosphatase PAP2 family protein [Fibrobacter sp.]|nr:phosphatase PAP2 family protein [Fibrobacter sp.]